MHPLGLEDYRRLREAVYRKMTNSLSRRVVAPTIPSLRRLAGAHINVAQRELELYFPPWAASELADKLAKSLSLRWDEGKARKPPVRSRAQREVDLLTLAMNASDQGSISRRKSAGKTRKTTVQRAFVKHGLAKPWLKKGLSAEALRVVGVIVGEVPLDGKRAIDLEELCAASYTEKHLAPHVFDEISQAGIGMQLWVSEVPAYGSAAWVVVVRGRKRSEEELKAWLLKADEKRKAAGRNPARPDQRHFIVETAPALITPVHSDFYSVLAVRQGTRSLTQWRRFVHASGSAYPVTDGPEGLIDREAIVTAIQSALRLETDLSKALGRAAGWISVPGTVEAGSNLFRIANILMARHGYESDAMALQSWSEEINYLVGVANGELPGRSYELAEAILDEDDVTVGDWIVRGELEMPEFLRTPLSSRHDPWMSWWGGEEDADLRSEEPSTEQEYLMPIDED